LSNRLGALAALTTGLALAGCGSSIDWQQGDWFQKPFDFSGREGGFVFSELQETRQRRPITANDLVQQNGSCPPPPAAASPAPAQPNPAVASNAPATPAVATDADPLLGEGVGLGMSECEVVYRAGQPTSIELGRNPNGDRTAVLTYDSGPRPGVYRFERGRLMEMDGVAEPAPPPQPQPKNATKKKKKPAAAPQQASTQ
jgi:hypothetical protein